MPVLPLSNDELISRLPHLAARAWGNNATAGVVAGSVIIVLIAVMCCLKNKDVSAVKEFESVSEIGANEF